MSDNQHDWRYADWSIAYLEDVERPTLAKTAQTIAKTVGSLPIELFEPGNGD